MDAYDKLNRIYESLEKSICKEDPKYSTTTSYEDDPVEDMLKHAAAEVMKSAGPGGLAARKSLHRSLSNFFEVCKMAIGTIEETGAGDLGGDLAGSDFRDPLQNPDPTSEESDPIPGSVPSGMVSENGYPKGGVLNGRRGGNPGSGPLIPPNAGAASVAEMAKAGSVVAIRDEGGTFLDDPNWGENIDMAAAAMKGEAAARARAENPKEAKASLRKQALSPADKERAKVRKDKNERLSRIERSQSHPLRGEAAKPLAGVAGSKVLLG